MVMMLSVRKVVLHLAVVVLCPPHLWLVSPSRAAPASCLSLCSRLSLQILNNW